MEYAPSAQVFLFILYHIVIREDQGVNKVPRKVLREITDPWLEQYTALSKKESEPRV